MSTADRFARVATALIGAFVLSTLSIGATAGQASAAIDGQSWIAQPSVVASAHG